MPGALDGIRVIELGGLGPAPFAAMMLADHGAEVLRIERPTPAIIQRSTTETSPKPSPSPESEAEALTRARPGLADFDVLNRNRGCAAIDLKSAAGQELLLDLCRTADVLIEGFRPGVAERLGFGPERLAEVNSRLVYARMTGWGQDGPLAKRAGHDINYLSLAGVQAHIGRVDAPPTPPLNLVGDFGGGGMMMAFGICAALLARQRTGSGQVIDAAMVDGSALLMAPLFGAHETGFWSNARGTNLLDSGAPFYDCYRCEDGGWLSVGAIEPQFFGALCAVLGLDEEWLANQHDQSRWAELRVILEQRFASAPRDHWVGAFDGVDACVSPVLTMAEVADHDHNRHRGLIVAVGDSSQPAPAPRFSATPADPVTPAELPGVFTAPNLRRWGISQPRIDALTADGVLA